MSEYVVSVRLKADGSGLVGEVRLSADALKDLAAQTGKAAAESGKTTAATRQLTEAQNAATAATKRGSSAWIDYMKGLAGYDVLLSAGRRDASPARPPQARRALGHGNASPLRGDVQKQLDGGPVFRPDLEERVGFFIGLHVLGELDAERIHILVRLVRATRHRPPVGPPPGG